MVRLSALVFTCINFDYVGWMESVFFLIRLGLAKMEVKTALLNSNLLADALLHSITAADANCKTLIVDTDLLSQFETIKEKFQPDGKVFFYSSNPKAQRPATVPEEAWLNGQLSAASSQADLTPVKKSVLKNWKKIRNLRAWTQKIKRKKLILWSKLRIFFCIRRIWLHCCSLPTKFNQKKILSSFLKSQPFLPFPIESCMC